MNTYVLKVEGINKPRSLVQYVTVHCDMILYGFKWNILHHSIGFLFSSRLARAENESRDVDVLADKSPNNSQKPKV